MNKIRRGIIETILLILISSSMFCCIINGQDRLKIEKVLEFKGREGGFASVSSVDDTLLVSYSYSYPDIDKPGGIFWFRNGKKIKSLDNLNFYQVQISPDGNYYLYVIDKVIHIKDKKDSIITKISTKDYLESVPWAWNSKTIYICEQGTLDKIFSYDISTKTKMEVLESQHHNQYFHPVAVKNNNVIYLLENKALDDPLPDCDIVQYDLLKKTFKTIKLPYIKNYSIYYDFTISPDEKIIIFNNINDGYIYVIDNTKNKIIDKIPTPEKSRVGQGRCSFSWKADSSYVIFTMDYKEIYKYTVPSIESLPIIVQGNPLTSEYANNYHQFPGGKKLSKKEQQEQISKANSLSDEGLAYYKAKKDDLAIAKYEEALKHYASAEIYYRYGNSLSNIPRLEDAVKAYQIAIELNYDKLGVVYYNIACTCSRMNKSKEAYANLELAINNGYKNFDHILKDEDLAWLRTQSDMKRIIYFMYMTNKIDY
jgi:tetratricopeptide (TPR) repeat protein